MRDITAKITTRRSAVAQAILVASKQETIEAVEKRSVPKGDVMEFSRAAGLLAIKRTSDVIPDCHPLPIEFASITSVVQQRSIVIRCEVHTLYKTGVEIEALHGATIAALTMYDMLKPLDKELEITSVRLISKHGGKTDYTDAHHPAPRTAVLVCSDSIAAGKKHDHSGVAIQERLALHGVTTAHYEILADEIELIQNAVIRLCNENYKLIILTGGTGLSPRDVTPEAVKPLLDREVPGIMEAARAYGQDRTPYSMLSRGVAGMRGDALILTLPGSTRGAEETIDALFPSVLHIFRVAKGAKHDEGTRTSE